MAIVVPPTLSVLVSVWMETLLYGINVVVYSSCLCVFLSKNPLRANHTQKGLVIVSSLLFASATAHIAVNLRRLIEGYVLPPTKEAMTQFLLDITVPTDVAKQFLLVIVNLFSDVILIWRVHLVWNGNWYITIIPISLCIGVFISGIGGATCISLATRGQSIFIHQIATWGTAFIALALLMNVTTTLLIATRIWHCTQHIRELAQARAGSQPDSSERACEEGVGSIGVMLETSGWERRNRYYWRIIVVIVESAAAAALAQTIELAFYTTNFPGVYFIADSVVQIVAISPLVIIAFAGLSEKRRQTRGTWSTTTSASHFNCPPLRHPPSSSSSSLPQHSSPSPSSTQNINNGSCSTHTAVKRQQTKRRISGFSLRITTDGGGEFVRVESGTSVTLRAEEEVVEMDVLQVGGGKARSGIDRETNQRGGSSGGNGRSSTGSADEWTKVGFEVNEVKTEHTGEP